MYTHNLILHGFQMDALLKLGFLGQSNGQRVISNFREKIGKKAKYWQRNGDLMLSALQAATILVALVSGKKFVATKIPAKVANWQPID